MFVYAADRIVLRKEFQDAWTRDICLNIPVLELEKWIGVREHLIQMLNFLTGDHWTINFIKRNLTKEEELFKEKRLENDKSLNNIDKVCMFSGGLDSFVGAIDVLTHSKDCVFVSHYGGGKGAAEYQSFLKGEMVKHFGVNISQFFGFYAVARGSAEDTMRSRSFMFFSHAICIASTFNKMMPVIIPENGLILLNIPFTNSRLGSSSTRTTHPNYMEIFRELLKKLDINVILKNPYQFYTKGEMLLKCSDKVFLEHNIENTMSCSHPDQGRRYKETEAQHCGYCLPCLIRRAAVLRADMVDNSKYRDANFSSGPTAKTNLNSYRQGLAKFNKKYAFLDIQKAGPISKDIPLFVDLYIRGMKEVQAFLEKINEL